MWARHFLLSKSGPTSSEFCWTNWNICGHTKNLFMQDSTPRFRLLCPPFTFNVLYIFKFRVAAKHVPQQFGQHYCVWHCLTMAMKKALLASLDDSDWLGFVSPFSLTSQELGTVWVFRNVAATYSVHNAAKPSGSCQPNNRKTIAVLKATYEIFSDCFPTDCGWWRMNNIGIDDAFLVLEWLSSKSLGMECSYTDCTFGVYEGDWPHRVQPAFRCTTATARPRCYCTLSRGILHWLDS